MSKELVVSSDRHETRVAVLEDDQVVEIYFQREKEYSLAGSIHKGRVTRVLPGMQSAFVDIGLERDAFLYVSDFFEDNEEYDKIVTSVEEQVFKLQRGGLPSPASIVSEPVVLPPKSEPVAEAPEAPAVEEAPVAAAPPRVEGVRPDGRESRESRDRVGPRDDRGGPRDDRRGGRRSRRRRPNDKGRGLPESKFYSPGAHRRPPRPRTGAGRSRRPHRPRRTKTSSYCPARSSQSTGVHRPGGTSRNAKGRNRPRFRPSPR